MSIGSTPSRSTASVRARQVAELPGPPAWPLVGNMLQFDLPRLHLQYEGWARTFGSTYRVRFGRRDAIVVSEPELVMNVLRARPDTWRRIGTLEPIFREMGLHGVFSAEGEDWRRQRRLVMAAFDPAHLRRFFASLVRVTERLQRRWARAAASGTLLDLQAELMRYSVDVTTGLAFGVDLNTVELEHSELHSHLDKIFPMLMQRLNAPFAYWRYVRLPADRAFEHHLRAIHAAIRDLVAAARRRLDSEPGRRAAPTDLLEAMLAGQDTDGSLLTEDEVVANVFTMLLAGEDTTANSLAWTLYLLHTHPEAWRTVIAEADATLAPDIVVRDIARVSDLPFTEASLNEAMRLHPVGPVQYLEAVRHTMLGDLTVPRGTLLFCLTRLGAVDEARIPNAAAFCPERWLEGGAELAGNSPRRLSLPFGAGPRLCPGRYLAMLEMSMVLSMLARNFELVEVGTTDGSPPAERLEFSMCPVGLHMRLAERSHER